MQQFSFEETPDSRQETFDPPTYTLIYKANGEQDDAIVQAYAIAATPSVVFRAAGALYRKDIKRDPDGSHQYIVTATYEKRERGSTPVGDFTFSFDTTGATVNIKAAKEHIASYPDDGDWHKGAIGVKADGDVEGADIIIPALKLTYNFKHPQAIVTESFARTLATVTGRTNSATFRGFQAGELLFLGATGSDGTEAEAEVSYQFAASENVTDLSIGEITSIAKKGHELVWISFTDGVESGEAVRKPKRVHVERCYDSFDFSSVFGWG